MGHKTQVINIRDAPIGWEHSNEYVYIGRPGKGQYGYFGNPFPLKPTKTRQAVLEEYRSYFYNRVLRDPIFKSNIEYLRDKTLVCFCKPKECHGDVIVEYLNHE